MSIRLHPRYALTKRFELDVREAVGRVVEQHCDKLTTLEIARSLHHVLSEEAGSFLNYAMRAERHPNEPDKKSDEA